MKKKKWWVFGAVLFVFAAVGLGIYLGNPAIPKENRRKEIPVQSVAQISGYAKSCSVRKQFLGILTPKDTVTVHLDEGRQIEGLLVAVGDRIENGVALASYDNSGLSLEREQAVLDMEQLEISLSSLYAQIRTLQNDRKQAPASEQGSYDLQILDLQTQAEQTEYDLSLKERDLERLDGQMSQTQVLSPCGGIVTEIGEDGKSITIVSEGTYEVTFEASEEEVREFQTGMAIVATDRDGAASCKGVISRVEAGAPGQNETEMKSPKASRYPVRAVMEQTDAFFAGQHVYVTLEEEAETEEADREAILLPEGYLMDPEGKPWVWAAGKDGRLEKRMVTTGAYNDRQNAYVIETGLSMTDYLAWPVDSLKEGQMASFGQ